VRHGGLGAVKHLIGRSLFASRLSGALLGRAGVVVTFHRVRHDADASDPLTIDSRTFDRYCRFFRRHFRVVPLPDLVTALASGRSLHRSLAITLDDGYRDNFEVAAPILERLALPATFFVVSRWIETDVVPYWDEDRGVRHPWMTWDQVRSLHRRGFDIGGHTRTHVDLGVAHPATAQAEIHGARLDLEDRLAAPVATFAYPFGTRRHLTDANRAIVKAAGFRCCCSNFGGTVAAGTDPFHLHRVPVSGWHVSPDEFGFDFALGRSLERA
jgi:peptidoglycan/xylan/chitin deacetylase (PgdA/CDA1 family)